LSSEDPVEKNIDAHENDENNENTKVKKKYPNKRYKIQEVIKPNQVILVQVLKDERGLKGAALSTFISIAGKYIVLMPNTPKGGGISRKIFNPGDRKKIRKPICYKPLREWIEETHETVSYKNLEGDDAIGLLATGKYKNNSVIVSGDKDMRTIPAPQVCIVDDQIEIVDENNADYNFCTQVLKGDSSDGYTGLVGCGTIKASRVLLDKKKLNEQWEAVLREYTRAKYSIDDAYHQARLARILREGEYNYATNKPKLWDYKYEYYRNFKEDRKAS